MPATAAGVYAIDIDGRSPRAENVRAIEKAVEHMPARFREAWLKNGGRLEIVPGCDARIHPLFSARATP